MLLSSSPYPHHHMNRKSYHVHMFCYPLEWNQACLHLVMVVVDEEVDQEEDKEVDEEVDQEEDKEVDKEVDLEEVDEDSGGGS